MKKTFILLTLLALFGITKAQTPGENFDVTHYEIHLNNIDFTNHTLDAVTIVTLMAKETVSSFVLELKSLTVSDVTSSNANVSSFSQNDDLLTINLATALATNATASFIISYGGNTFNESWGGIMWTNGYVCNMGVGFESIPHNLGKCWFPCVDNFTDKATYDIYVTVPTAMAAVCGGNFVNDNDNLDGTHTVHYNVPQEIATYHISFVAGDYVEWTDTYNGVNGDIPITVYVKPSQINKVEGTFVNVKDIANFYENCFGPYPFNRIGYSITSVGCMEHIDNIGITSGVLTGNTSQESYVAHELSHMWFGNKVTCATAEQMWLNEGMAQFCGIFYRSEVYGEEDFQDAISSLTNTITSWCKSESHWIPLNNVPLSMTYDGSAVYDRGAVVANTMMNYMGRENFLTGLRHYLETYAYGAVTSEQLRDALTEATGIDMNGFFDTYVFTAGMPHYNACLAEATPNGAQYDALVKLSYWHVGPSHIGQNNRVEVTFVGANGQKHTELVGWDGLEAETTVSLDFEPIAAFVDYYNHFLDAKLDKNLLATAPANSTQGNFKAIVNSVTDSTLLRIEEHFVEPDNDPEIPYLTLSTRRYWNFFRNDFGEADVTAQITYSYAVGQDDDLIHTENDSAVLLYRANVMDPWHTIPYTQEGIWRNGCFTVNNAQSGQYAIAVIDKTLWGVNEDNELERVVYPNPSHGIIMVPSGEYRITNLSGQTVKTDIAHNQINVSELPAGIYFITINGKTQKFVIQ